MGDNKGMLSSSGDAGSVSKKKNEYINWHFIRENCATGAIQLAKVHTDDNEADAGTKQLQGQGFVNNRARCLPSPSLESPF